jgi:putative phosphoesterase
MGKNVQSMKLAFISDTHGNALALSNCLSFIRSQAVYKIFHLGDAIGYLPNAHEVLSILHDNDVECIKGNHEAMVVGQIACPSERKAVYLIPDTKASMGSTGLQTISEWREQLELQIGAVRLLMVHGSPWDKLEGYVYPDTDLERFIELDVDIVLMGHTHHPFERKVGRTIVVNVGSVGLPRDVGHLSSVCILDLNYMTPHIYRIPFDVAAVRLEALRYAVDEMVWACMARQRQHFVGELVKAV